MGAADISYFIVQSLTTEIRREHGDCLATRNLQALVDYGCTELRPAEPDDPALTLRIAHAFATVPSVRASEYLAATAPVK